MTVNNNYVCSPVNIVPPIVTKLSQRKDSSDFFSGISYIQYSSFTQRLPMQKSRYLKTSKGHILEVRNSKKESHLANNANWLRLQKSSGSRLVVKQKHCHKAIITKVISTISTFSPKRREPEDRKAI